MMKYYDNDEDIEEWRKEVADVKPLIAADISSATPPISSLPQGMLEHDGIKLQKPIKTKQYIQQTISIAQMAVRYPNYERETPTVRLSKVDSSMMRQLRLDRLPITHKLDLHDMNMSMAYEALQGFLRGAMQDGAKIALVITGKGSTGGIGELRRNLPRWCIEPAFQPMVVALSQACLHHGGVGAFYVQIRRR